MPISTVYHLLLYLYIYIIYIFFYKSLSISNQYYLYVYIICTKNTYKSITLIYIIYICMPIYNL